MGDLRRLDEIDPTDLARVGGKAAGLARLMALGMPVPPGYVLTAAAQNAALDGALGDELGAALAELAAGGGAVAVRSSSTAEDLPEHSFAGQHDTVLGVRDRGALLAAVRRCWVSLNSERAAGYRRRHGIASANVAMAVVLQRMVPAEISGVLFTVDPVTGRRDRIVIEACAGLGEELVSGRITPEQVALARPGLAVAARVEAPDAGGPLLSDERAAALAALALRIEAAWGGPVDVEWALAGGEIAILQARAVTTLAAKAGSGAEEDEDWAARQVWTNVNAGEVAPDVVTPLTWDLIEPIATRLLGVFFEMAGVEIAGHRVLGLVCGRVYFNLNTMLGLLRRLPGMEGKGVLQLFGGEEKAPPEIGDLKIPDEDIPKVRSSLLGLLTGLLGLLWGLWRFPRGGGARVVARMRADADDLEALRPDDQDDAALACQIAAIAGAVQADTRAFRAMAFATIMPMALYRLCGSWFGAEGNDFASRLMGGLGGAETADAGLDLWRLAARVRGQRELAALVGGDAGFDEVWRRLEGVEGGIEFAAAWEHFMRKHGHHTRAELELSNPRWVEQPEILLGQVRGCLAGMDQRDLEEHYRGVVARREQTERDCRARLGLGTRLLFGLLLGAAQHSAPFRETIKSQMVRKLMVLRRLALAAGERLRRSGALVAVEDVFYLHLEELDAALRCAPGEDLGSTVAARRAEREQFQGCNPPPVLRGRYNPDLHRWDDPAAAPDGVLRGIPVSPGVVTGPARVILRAGEDRVRPGEILVAPFTDPGWTPYFLNASAIVMDLGGMLSHGSIIARELGIPAVVNVDRATRRITTGQCLQVDGARGIVHVLKS